MTIWFTADTHYGHKNIVRGVSNWGNKSGCRDFATIADMNDAMVDSINACVKEDDVLYHVGDLVMGLFQNVSEFRQRLNCRTIHLVLGNHDHNIRKDRDGIQQLFTSVQQQSMICVEDEQMVLCHYPLHVWQNHHRGTWHLHGHTHGKLNDPAFYQRKVMDVGIDTHPEFRPYSFAEVKAILDQREIVPLDFD